MKYNKKLIKNILTGIFALLLLFWLFQIDWNNMSSKSNSGALFGVLSGALFIISMQIKNKEPKK
ncbi:hypothetical protein H0I29_16010 [Polaribacter sp. R2A056_3_33]|uniref:hypothetical protein n=1 Tax=Polaribacter sp. R2A056_3_33 TaxID=2745563 RepID=UPI001C4F6AAF|nr:hypothetical protein [Polaribacter sp. R2A056_3_33]QXP70099.1 hypothetical protein H0I29_16010 [Polaribacter sp. R2A056_3_33]